MKRIAFLFMLVLGLALQAFAQNAIEPPLITVNGQAEVRVAPDEVLFSLDVESIDKDMLAAKAKTDASVRRILEIAKKNRVKDEDVQTSQISVSPKYNTDNLDYEQRRNQKRVFEGYEVSKTVAVRLRDISRFDDLLSDVLKAGVTSVNNFSFQNSEIRKYRDQARAMAMKAAQEKATLMAKQIGQSIGPAYSITEQTERLYSTSNFSQNATSEATESATTTSTIAPGTISASAQVIVRFRLQ